MIQYAVEFTPDLLQGLRVGASVSIDGVCQTVVKVEGVHVWFDAIQETLNRTTLKSLETGRWVNVERAARWGDEIGGHLLSGHVHATAQIVRKDLTAHHCVMALQCDSKWMKYFFSKGFIALDGASLTLVDVSPLGEFTVHLIPETLNRTTLGKKNVGDWVNVEVDAQTQAIVETVERMHDLI